MLVIAEFQDLRMTALLAGRFDWRYPVKRLIFSRLFNLFAEFVNLLLLLVILLLEEFALFRDEALVILQVLGLYEFVADPAFGLQD